MQCLSLRITFILLKQFLAPKYEHAFERVFACCGIYYVYVEEQNTFTEHVVMYVLQSGARMSVGDGTLTIVAKNQSVMGKILEKVFLPFC